MHLPGGTVGPAYFAPLTRRFLARRVPPLGPPAHHHRRRRVPDREGGDHERGPQSGEEDGCGLTPPVLGRSLLGIDSPITSAPPNWSSATRTNSLSSLV